MESRKPLWPAKLGWFALYWLASVAALAVVAYAIRWAIH
jgi:hypothetical protein